MISHKIQQKFVSDSKIQACQYLEKIYLAEYLIKFRLQQIILTKTEMSAKQAIKLISGLPECLLQNLPKRSRNTRKKPAFQTVPQLLEIQKFPKNKPKPEGKPAKKVEHQIQKQKIQAPIKSQINLKELVKMNEQNCLIESNKLSVNSELLLKAYIQCQRIGGIQKINSIGKLEQTLISVFQKENINIYSQLQTIKNILFTYELKQKKCLFTQKIYQLGKINFVDYRQLDGNKYDIQKGMKYFLYDLTLFQEGAKGLKIDEKKFNLEYMGHHYRKNKMDIRIQRPCDYGFHSLQLSNWPYQMTIGDYRYYQEHSLDKQKMSKFKHSHQLIGDQVFFGVNFEPTDNMLHKQIKKNVKGTFLDYHSEFDLLSYLDHDVPGCSSPQMYFKTKGCWTGGHQENISMSALNINHGPDQSEWYTLQLQHVQEFRRDIKQKFKIDIFTQEGLWYEKLEWFLKEGYPVKRFLQRKDDIVVSGPGTLHWVRSYGKALQTSWNLMPKTLQQMKAAFTRQKINKQINFIRSNIIPLKSLIIKFLNHQRVQMNKDMRILCTKQLQSWLNEEKNIRNQFNNDKITDGINYLSDLQSFCEECNQQILIFYHLNLDTNRIICLQCLNKEQNRSKVSNLNQNIKISYKYPIKLLQKLIEICLDDDKNQINTKQIADLCKGKHIGNVNCSVQSLQKSIEIEEQNCKNAQNKSTIQVLVGCLRNKDTFSLQKLWANPKQFLQINQICDNLQRYESTNNKSTRKRHYRQRSRQKKTFKQNIQEKDSQMVSIQVQRNNIRNKQIFQLPPIQMESQSNKNKT